MLTRTIAVRGGGGGVELQWVLTLVGYQTIKPFERVQLD